MRGILHEGEIDKRVQYMIEGLFAVRKKKFEEFPAIPEGLDLGEEDDRITHEIALDDDLDPESKHDYFRKDPEYALNEKAYEQIKAEILGESSDDGSDGSDGSGSEEESSSEEEEWSEATSIVSTEANRTASRRPPRPSARELEVEMVTFEGRPREGDAFRVPDEFAIVF